MLVRGTARTRNGHDTVMYKWTLSGHDSNDVHSLSGVSNAQSSIKRILPSADSSCTDNSLSTNNNITPNQSLETAQASCISKCSGESTDDKVFKVPELPKKVKRVKIQSAAYDSIDKMNADSSTEKLKVKDMLHPGVTPPCIIDAPSFSDVLSATGIQDSNRVKVDTADPGLTHGVNGACHFSGAFRVRASFKRKLQKKEPHATFGPHTSHEAIEKTLMEQCKTLIQSFEYPFETIPLLYVILSYAGANLGEATRRIADANMKFRDLLWERRMLKCAEKIVTEGSANYYYNTSTVWHPVPLKVDAPTYCGEVPRIGGLPLVPTAINFNPLNPHVPTTRGPSCSGSPPER